MRLSSTRRTPWTKTLAVFTLLILLPSLFAQSSAISNAMAPMALYINIIEGEDALNNIHERAAREPIVQVTDENHQPVKGAVVTFNEVAGTTGAAATFGGVLTYKTVTDANGKAVGRGFTPNKVIGEHQVEVAAALGMLVAAAVIHEKNVAEGGVLPPPHGRFAAGLGSSAWFIGEFAAVASAVGIFLGVHADDTSGLSSSGNAVVTTTTTASVPEIDPLLAFGCLTFLAGTTAVLRGRKR